LPAWDAFEISTAVAILRREAAPHGLPLLAIMNSLASGKRLSDAAPLLAKRADTAGVG
jgi:hypothetical protein